MFMTDEPITKAAIAWLRSRNSTWSVKVAAEKNLEKVVRDHIKNAAKGG